MIYTILFFVKEARDTAIKTLKSMPQNQRKEVRRMFLITALCFLFAFALAFLSKY